MLATAAPASAFIFSILAAMTIWTWLPWAPTNADARAEVSISTWLSNAQNGLAGDVDLRRQRQLVDAVHDLGQGHHVAGRIGTSHVVGTGDDLIDGLGHVARTFAGR